MFCAYALPLLGLIGTLTGITRVVSWLSAPEADISLATLGASFDAALVALVTTFVLLFFISMTQASEEEVVSAAHDYCLEHLPKRIEGAATHPL
jgi:biopolymer transport protein ExbB/TolQ